MSAAELRAALVAGLRRDGYLNVPAVERAFLRVPRERFLPGLELAEVYRDAAILIKEEGGIGVASSSQPAIMAIMLEMLDTHPGQRVLEVGAGSGYNAAILRELVGESGAVASVEIDAEVATWARERLGAAGYPDVAVRHADGAEGWPGGAPWDRVIVTVGAGDIASAWVSSSRGGIRLPRAGAGAGVVAFERLGERLSRAGIEPAAYPRARGLADAASGRVRAGINALTTEGRAARLRPAARHAVGRDVAGHPARRTVHPLDPGRHPRRLAVVHQHRGELLRSRLRPDRPRWRKPGAGDTGRRGMSPARLRR